MARGSGPISELWAFMRVRKKRHEPMSISARCFVRHLPAVTFVALVALPSSARGQLLRQSDLTVQDADPDFELTLDLLSTNSRWMGVPARNATWSLDGERVYFQWREDPEPGQVPATDPWYAVDRSGTEVRRLDATEAALVPGAVLWAADRSTAVWTRDDILFVWDGTETHTVYRSERDLRGLRVTADGRQVFFAHARGSSEGDPEPMRMVRDAGDLWVADLDGGTVRQIAATHLEEADDSTDANKWLAQQQLDLIATVRKRKRDREVTESVQRSLDIDPVQAIPVGKGAAVSNVRLTPDGRFMTFQWTKDPEGDLRTEYLEYVNESGYATPQTARPKVGEPRPEFRMGIVAVDPTVLPDSIAVTWVEAPSAKAVITHGPDWSPTGEHGVVQILSMDHKDRWIALLDAETGALNIVDHQHEDAWIDGPLVGGRWSAGWLQWLPDGSGLAFASAAATGWSMLYLADTDGSVTQLTQGEWEVRGAQLSPDAKMWYLTTSREHPGEEHLYRLPVRGGDLERLTWGEGMHRAVVSPRGDRVATLFETTRLMPDLYLMDASPDDEPTRITKSGTDDFYRMVLLDSEILRFNDYAGGETWAEVFESPANDNGAAVVYVHGCGECAQGVTKGWRRTGTKLYAKYLHDRGFVTASLDYRGSSGYGQANRTYAYRQMGISDIDSGLALLDILEANYGVDPARIGVYGGSYGGFFTIMALFRHPDRWRAGVALFPVTDWAHYNDGYTSRILNGSPLTDEEAYRVSSPIYYVDNYQRGLQIQHGLVDNNVQIQDSFRLSQVLMEKKKDFELVVYPVEPHGWREDSSRRDSYQRMTRWFNRELLGESPPVRTDGSGSQQR